MRRWLGGMAVLLALAGGLLACRKETSGGSGRPRSSSGEADTIRIAAAVAPVSWLACELAGAPCEAVTLVPPGASAHTFEPKPSLLSSLSGTRLYFSTGLAFEQAWVPRLRAGLAQLQVIVLHSPAPLPSQDADERSESCDPHVWSSPRAMIPWTDSVAAALLAAYPGDSARIRANLGLLRLRMEQLDAQVRKELAPFSGKRFYINHPELGYLARDYGLQQMPLEEGGREPSLPFLRDARETAHRQGIRAVFAQETYGTRTAEALAHELEVPVVTLDLYAQPYDSAILRVARTLATHL